MRKTSTAKDAIELLTDEAERLNADSNDSTGIVRELVAANMPGRPDAQFSAWFCVCCELANRAARKEGYFDAVERAWALSHSVAERETAIACAMCGSTDGLCYPPEVA